MFAALRYRYKLSRIEAAQRRIRRLYAKDIRQDKNKKLGLDDVRQLEARESFEWRFAEDEKQDLKSSFLLAKAYKLSLLVPGLDDKNAWEFSNNTQHLRLSAQTQRELILAIRAERKDRSENARLWLTGLTGLVGAASGLIALLLRK